MTANKTYWSAWKETRYPTSLAELNELWGAKDVPIVKGRKYLPIEPAKRLPGSANIRSQFRTNPLDYRTWAKPFPLPREQIEAIKSRYRYIQKRAFSGNYGTR